jgi:hypothetical protein
MLNTHTDAAFAAEDEEQGMDYDETAGDETITSETARVLT